MPLNKIPPSKLATSIVPLQCKHTRGSLDAMESYLQTLSSLPTIPPTSRVCVGEFIVITNLFMIIAETCTQK